MEDRVKQTARSLRRTRCFGLVVCALLGLGGCASIVGGLTAGLATDLGTAILDNDDPLVVRDGAPAFLIILDALLNSDPDNVTLLRASAQLNSAYASAFVAEPARQKSFATKALDLAHHAACRESAWACDAKDLDYETLEACIAVEDDVDLLYIFESDWAGYIQANSSDWKAIAQLGRVKPMMRRVAELDADYDNGGAYMYLGVFETLVPPGLGGKPELGREYFERAIEISEGSHLMAKVLFAEQYARMLFERELHDELLQGVIAADARVPGLTLINRIAQEQARELLGSADEYF